MILVILVLTTNVAMGAKITPADIIGDPLSSFSSIQAPVKWLLGFALACFVIVSVAAILVGGTTAQMGALMKNAALRQHGMSGVFGVIGMVIVVVLAVMIFWFVITKFLMV